MSEPQYQIRAGQKYWKTIYSIPKTDGTHDSCVIDVYSVLNCFEVKCAPRQHAIKKLLCAGKRSKGDELQDLVEAGEALQRSIDEVRRQYAEEKDRADRLETAAEQSTTKPVDPPEWINKFRDWQFAHNTLKGEDANGEAEGSGKSSVGGFHG